MANIDTTGIRDPATEPQADGSPSFGLAAPSPPRLLYWSVRRELWEHRWTYIVPLIVAAVVLLGFAIGFIRLLHAQSGGSQTVRVVGSPLDLASLAVMLTYVVITVIYCLGALHGERTDRSILFWKSLPVSDVTTVLAKASMPLIVLPLIAFAIIVVTQGIMLAALHAVGAHVIVAAGAAPAARGLGGAAPWTQMSPLPMWAALLYHLLSIHALYYAPIYGWLLLASAWARRAAFLWAGVPIAAVLIFERLVFNTSAFANLLLARLQGGPAAIPFPPRGNMPMQAPTLANMAAFLASPGLWIGLAICAVLLAAAVRLRRHQGPI